MENVIKLIDVLVWPLTVLILALVFKSQFGIILKRMNKFKYKDLEASFDKELSLVEKTTKETNKAVDKSTVNSRSTYEHTLARILKLAEVSPRACISEAWREIESVTISLIHAHGHDPRNVQMSKVFRGIVHDNGYSWSLYEDYKRLMRLRNQAVHADEFDINQEEAERYSHTAIDLAVFIKKLVDEAANKQINKD